MTRARRGVTLGAVLFLTASVAARGGQTPAGSADRLTHRTARIARSQDPHRRGADDSAHDAGGHRARAAEGRARGRRRLRPLPGARHAERFRGRRRCRHDARVDGRQERSTPCGGVRLVRASSAAGRDRRARERPDDRAVRVRAAGAHASHGGERRRRPCLGDADSPGSARREFLPGVRDRVAGRLPRREGRAVDPRGGQARRAAAGKRDRSARQDRRQVRGAVAPVGRVHGGAGRPAGRRGRALSTGRRLREPDEVHCRHAGGRRSPIRRARPSRRRRRTPWRCWPWPAGRTR